MNHKIRLLTWGWTAVALVSFASAQSYKVIQLGALGGESYAAGINGKGQVAGTSYISNHGQGGHHTHAFLWTSGKGMQDLGTLGGKDSEGFAVNNLGQVVGLSWLAGDAKSHAFLWTQAGGMQDLGTLGGPKSAASAISRSGQVAGWAETTSGDIDAFLWTAAGGMQDLGNLGGGEAFATAITDDGVVTGYSYTQSDGNNRIFLWTSHGGMKDLGKLDAKAAAPTAINNQLTIVGSFFPKGSQEVQAFVRLSGMKAQDIGLGESLGVNSAGSVVGETTPDGNGDAAFLWTQAAGMLDLGKLIPPHQGKTLIDAVSISANGKIAGDENISGLGTRAVLLVPSTKR
jgi:probable HAF family extracellular repeat protein